jgi:hypothetical protein
MGIEPTSEAWEASILPLYDARSFLQLSDYTQRGNCWYRPAASRIFQIYSGKRPHAPADRRSLFVEFFRQKADGGRGKREQAKVTEERPEKRTKARISPPEMNTIHDSLHPHAPRMVKTGQQASLIIL